MRLDKFLKLSRVLKRRTVAQQACESNKVCVNGNTAKAGKQLVVGDIIEISFGQKTLKLQVANILNSTKKSDSQDMYKIIGEIANEVNLDNEATDE
ncbi:MAG: RNA-binding S4 domain-containing protein [Firmicutes bacterium]|nr:RNA-binding S4 domain-containing protein [Bacillota bacterium]